jgi:hypothetical protein
VDRSRSTARAPSRGSRRGSPTTTRRTATWWAQVSAGNVSPFAIRGRTIAASTGTTGSQFSIATPGIVDPGDKIHPGVAGDPHLSPPTYFTVVWERVVSPADHDIHGRQVTNAADPVLVGVDRIDIDSSSAFEQQPQISAACSPPTDSIRRRWKCAIRCAVR